MTIGALGYILSGAKLLLGKPANMTRWNGIGGVVNIGDSAASVLGKSFQSLGMTASIPEALGDVLYHHPIHGTWRAKIYRIDDYHGQAVSTPALQAEWFSLDDIPFDQMWPGDDLWIPCVVENQKFTAELWFDRNDKLTQHDVQKLT